MHGGAERWLKARGKGTANGALRAVGLSDLMLRPPKNRVLPKKQRQQPKQIPRRFAPQDDNESKGKGKGKGKDDGEDNRKAKSNSVRREGYINRAKRRRLSLLFLMLSLPFVVIPSERSDEGSIFVFEMLDNTRDSGNA